MTYDRTDLEYLLADGAKLEPLDGKVAFRERPEGPGATLDELTSGLAGAKDPAVGIVPASRGCVVVDLDVPEAAEFVRGILSNYDVYWTEAKSQSGGTHFLIPHPPAPPVREGKVKGPNGEAIGDFRHTTGIVRIADWDAWTQPALTVQPKAPQALQALGGRAKEAPIEVSDRPATTWTREYEPDVADLLTPAVSIGESDRENTLYKACANQPLLAEYYAQEARERDLEERNIAKSGRKGARDGRAQGNHLLRNPWNRFNPAIRATILAQCPIPYRYAEDGWYRWRSGQGWERAEAYQVRDAYRSWFFELMDYKKLTDDPSKYIKMHGLDNWKQMVTALQDERRLIHNEDPWTLGLPGNRKLCVTPTGYAVHDATAFDGLTKQLPVVPEAGEPTRLLQVLQGAGLSDEHVAWTRAFMKYMLTGTVTHQFFIFAYGPAGTGKSTFAKACLSLAGDYGTSILADNFTNARRGAHPTWLITAAQARLMVIEEHRPGEFSPTLKSLVSGDQLSARRLYQDEQTITPTCKVIVTGNQAPRWPPGDGMRRRVGILPFDQKPDRVDERIDDAIREELGEVLHWALTADLSMLHHLPENMREAAELYEEDFDHVGRTVMRRLEPSDEELLVEDVTTQINLELESRHTERHVRESLRRMGFKTRRTQRQGVNVYKVKAQWRSREADAPSTLTRFDDIE